jgi:hypothetical protein
MPRRPIGERAMTGAERLRRWRERKMPATGGRPAWAFGRHPACRPIPGKAAMADDLQFKPGELEQACELVHILFESLPSAIAEHALRACWRTRWPHLGRDHLVHVLQTALRQAEWRQ